MKRRGICFAMSTDPKTRDSRDLLRLKAFWNSVFAQTEQETDTSGDSPKALEALAPAPELYRAAASLGQKQRVLDYGCGDGWASAIAAVSGCRDTTAADPSENAVRSASLLAETYGCADRVHPTMIDDNWLLRQPDRSFDGIICSNVLDVIPPDAARQILIHLARVAAADAVIFIGLNFHMTDEAAERRGIRFEYENRVYMDGVLRLVSLSDEEWRWLLGQYFTVEELTYFAWPGEESKTRRLFRLSLKKEGPVSC